MKNTVIFLIVIILIVVGAYYLIQMSGDSNSQATLDQNSATKVTPPEEKVPVETVQAPEQYLAGSQTIIGKSAGGRDIVASHYGNGSKRILFVGGIHGGYSWNTSLVAFELMDYLKGNTSAVSENVQATVIPVLNPDGLNKVVAGAGRFVKSDVVASKEVQISGRFNENKVDINRNFDCNWKSEGVWQSRTVSGGSEVFSEPESLAIKNFIEKYKPSAVVVWYSAAGGVYSSSCHNGILPETKTITNAYAQASGYPAFDKFEFYEVTGDMVNWLAKVNIPATSILLSTHTDAEWDKNLAGIKAILAHYAQ